MALFLLLRFLFLEQELVDAAVAAGAADSVLEL